jgi:hypothetical protein
VLELGMLDLEEIATALQDQNSWDHCWLIDPQSGQIGFWTEDGGIDGRTPVDLEDLDLIPIEPLPSWVWYQDMATSPRASPISAPAAAWPERSRARARSAGSKIASTRTTPTCCRLGTPSSRPGGSGARFSG